MQYRVSPFIGPEYYPRTQSSPYIVKALFLPSDIQYEPQIITETPEEILSICFKEEKPRTVFTKTGFHMYISPTEQYIGRFANHVATALIRHEYLTKFGSTNPDVVCGNVVIFGTINIPRRMIDGKDHSVPYHIVEEAIRIYDTQGSNQA
jgi:hypothetical protein